MKILNRVFGIGSSSDAALTNRDGFVSEDADNTQDEYERQIAQHRIKDENLERILTAHLKALELGIELLRPEVERIKHERHSSTG